MAESNLNITEALIWIKAILDDEGVPYQIVGGLAARIYGATRPLIDIDMYIPRGHAEVILPRVKEYISKPFKHYTEDVWDIEYFQLKYNGQKIEIAVSPGARFFDKKKSEWVDQTIDFSKSQIGEFEKIQIPVMPRDELVAYKRLLGREVDRADIDEIGEAD
jgi:hypothetical protein